MHAKGEKSFLYKHCFLGSRKIGRQQNERRKIGRRKTGRWIIGRRKIGRWKTGRRIIRRQVVSSMEKWSTADSSTVIWIDGYFGRQRFFFET